MGFWSVGTPHFGGSIIGATVEVVVVCGVATTLPQLEIARARSSPPSIGLNLEMSTLPRLRSLHPLRRGRDLPTFDLLRCFPSSTDRQSFVRDLPMSS